MCITIYITMSLTIYVTCIRVYVFNYLGHLYMLPEPSISQSRIKEASFYCTNFTIKSFTLYSNVNTKHKKALKIYINILIIRTEVIFPQIRHDVQ